MKGWEGGATKPWLPPDMWQGFKTCVSKPRDGEGIQRKRHRLLFGRFGVDGREAWEQEGPRESQNP